MKKRLLVGLLFVCLCFSANAVNAQSSNQTPEVKEVYVNLDTVWRASDQGKKDLTEIDTLVQQSKDEVMKLREELKAMGDEFGAAKSDAEKQEKAKQIEQKRRELIEITTIKNKEIEAKRNEAQQKFVETIIPLVNKYRQENGYLVIHRYTANDIVSIDPKVDITEEILQIYNK